MSDRLQQIQAWICHDISEVRLSLTGPDSHILYNEPGLGSLMIAPREFCRGKTDLAVDADARIQWAELSPFTTPAGGPWPRWLYYIGNDVSMFDWMRERETEFLDWTPTRAVSVDARHARISTLQLNLTRGVKVEMMIPSGLREMSIVGDISLLDAVFDDARDCRLNLSPATKARQDGSLVMVPKLPAFSDVRSVCLRNEPCRQSIDAASILQFPMLTQLDIYGAVGHLEVLQELRELEGIGLRNMSDLSELPALFQWPKLKNFIAWNIEERAGKALRTQARALKKTEGYVSVSKLRKSAWFKSEYGLPFSGWSPQNARKATKAYRVAEAAMPLASNRQDVLNLLKTFGAVISKLPGLETPERDDVAVAFAQLVELSKIEIEEGALNACFHEVCDF